MKRLLPDGTTHLLFTGLELLRRVESLVPPPRTNLTKFHGVFAPGAKLRPFLVPPTWEAGEEEQQQQEGNPSLAPGVEELKKRRTPPLEWAGLQRRSLALDIFACAHCGGRRRVLAWLKARQAVRSM